MKSFTAQSLTAIIQRDFPSQRAFADTCGIEKHIVTKDASGANAHIPDERFRIYLIQFAEGARVEFINAMIRDRVPSEAEHLVWDSKGEIQLELGPRIIPKEMAVMLRWLASELVDDPELYDAVSTFCRYSGFDPKEFKISYLPAGEEKSLRVAEDEPLTKPVQSPEESDENNL